MHRHTFLGIVTLLIWVAGANHCALELLVSGLGHQSASAAQSPSDESTDCPGHSDKDPSKHKEGELCGGAALFESKSSIQPKLVFVSLKTSPLAAFVIQQITAAAPATLPRSSESISPPILLLRSSIASNAPPLAV